MRDQGSIVFLVLRDTSGGKVQVVVTDDFEQLGLVSSLKVETIVKVEGVAVKNKQAKLGGVEIQLCGITVYSEPAEDLPIHVTKHKREEAPSLPVRLDYKWLEMRKEKVSLIYKIWTTLEQAYVEACIDEGLIQIHSPKIMSTPSEGGSEFFELKYFESKAYLAQSPQFYKQMAQAAGLGGVFEIGPVFRAEPSFTTRHATEFTGYDFELSFIESHYDIMDLEERILVKMLTAVKIAHGEKIKSQYGKEIVVPEVPFPKLKMSKLKKLLAREGVQSKGAHDISPEEERTASKIARKMYGHEFLFVTDYSPTVRPFYHMRYEDSDDKAFTKSFDLLWNGIEITTGAQREHRYEVLKEQATEKGVSHESIEKYLQFFKYGCPPHGGAGIGAERILMQLLGIENIREVSFLARDPKRLDP